MPMTGGMSVNGRESSRRRQRHGVLDVASAIPLLSLNSGQKSTDVGEGADVGEGHRKSILLWCDCQPITSGDPCRL
jgi:hypothetical protein